MSPLLGVRVGFDSGPERDLGGGFEGVGLGVEGVGGVGDAFNVEVVGVLAKGGLDFVVHVGDGGQ